MFLRNFHCKLLLLAIIASSAIVASADSTITENGRKYYVPSEGPLSGQKLMELSENYLSGSYILRSKKDPNFRIDIAAGTDADGTNAQIWDSSTQSFTITHVAGTGGYYKICFGSNDRCLDIQSNPETVSNGNNIHLWTYGGGDNQLWKIERNDDGSFTIRTKKNNDYVLDIKNGTIAQGSNLQLYESNGTDAQKWLLEPVNKQETRRNVADYYFERYLIDKGLVKIYSEETHEILATTPQNAKYGRADANYKEHFVVLNPEEITELMDLGTYSASKSIAIRNFQGIGYFINLTRLGLNSCTLYKDFLWKDQNNCGLNGTSCPNLEYIDVRWTGIGSDLVIKGFPKLKEINFFDNNQITSLDLSDNSSIEKINIGTCSKLKWVKLNNCNLSGMPTIELDGNTTSFNELYLDDNKFTAIPVIPSQVSTLWIRGNQLTGVNVPNEDKIKYLYIQRNTAFPSNLTVSGLKTVEGLDLAECSFSTLTVENNPALKSLYLMRGNDNLRTLNLHGNPSLTKFSNDQSITGTNGVQIKGMSKIETLNLENSSFNSLGAHHSLEGCTGITTLKAKNNKFTTFYNSYNSYNWFNTTGAVVGTRNADSSKPSLEHLTGLKYLDLSHNELQDSVHLYKNRNLETLIVCHNRHIDRYKDFNDYVANSKITNDKQDCKQNTTGRGKKYFDFQHDKGCFNDTTGLRTLNLSRNNKLKYIDFSYTSIRATAAATTFTHDGKYESTHLNMFSQSKYNEVTSALESHLILLSPTFRTLEEIHADYNYMYTGSHYVYYTDGSRELAPFAKLKVITQRGSYGQDPAIFDGVARFNGIGQWPVIEYLDYSDSDFDGFVVNSMPTLKFLNVSRNWTLHDRTSDPEKNGDLNLTKCPNLVECRADHSYYLHSIHASGLRSLSSICVEQDNGAHMSDLYVDNTALTSIANNEYTLPTFPTRQSCDLDGECEGLKVETYTPNLGMQRIGTAKNLKLLYCHTNEHLTDIDVTGNEKLEYLHAYDNRFGEDYSGSGINLRNNTALKSLRVARNGLQMLPNNISAQLDTLVSEENYNLEALDITKNIKLRYLNTRRCHIGSLDVTKNTILNYIDISNEEEPDGEKWNWISELHFTSPELKTIWAQHNNLYTITFPASTKLETIDFRHNHINGIDLTHSSVANINIMDEDNGRTILAECAATGIPEKPRVYYFQMKENAGDAKDENYNTFLGSKESYDELKGELRPSLADDGFSMSNYRQWTAGVSGTVTGQRKAASVGDIDASKVYGNIVVLTPSFESGQMAEGRALYTYYNGRTNSTFYLDWSAAGFNGVVTDIDDINAARNTVKTQQGCVIVNGSNGMPVAVYDIAGRLVANETINQGELVINLPAGIYIVAGQKVVVK